MEAPTVELMGFKTSQEEIQRVYNELYQLKRAPGVEPCDVEMVKNILQEMLDSVKEHLCCRQDHAQLMEELG